jgi:hypothetical protein
MESSDIDELYAVAFLSFSKYWPDDNLVRLKLVLNLVLAIPKA